MDTITRGITYTDLMHRGHARVIATAVIQSPGGVALVDPGPSSCLETLRRALADHGIAVSDLRALLLTHIHLDHAGATGSLVKENPEIAVYVHERGAPHMIDPATLLASATRLYGDAMDALWGEFLPVPEANVQSLSGGERIAVADRELEVAYTPGHASHHVSYFDRASGIAFVGDAAGVRTGRALFVLPPTPPPDIDIEVWGESVELIRRWQAATLFVTHFGPHEDPPAQLACVAAASRRDEGAGAEESRGRRERRGPHDGVRRRHADLPAAASPGERSRSLRACGAARPVLARVGAVLAQAWGWGCAILTAPAPRSMDGAMSRRW